MSYNLQYQTNVVPKELFGLGSSGGTDVSMSVSPTGIILKGDLNTPNPITATISQAGIITDNPAGFDILSSLNMNQNNITNVASIINEGNDLLINTGATATDINISAGSVLNLTGISGVNVTTTDAQDITITSDSNLNLNSTNGTMALSSGPIDINSTGEISLNPNSVVSINHPSLSKIQFNTGASLNPALIYQDDAEDLYITNNAPQIVIENTFGGVGIMSGDYIHLTCPEAMNIGSTNGGVIISAQSSSTQINSFQNEFTSTEDTNINTTGGDINITQTGTYQNYISFNSTGVNAGDITINSLNGSVNITAGNGDAGNSGITLTSPEGNISLNPSLSNFVVCDSFIYAQQGGFNGPMYHNDQPTTAATYYLTFVQSAGISGYYIPNFDSATLTYNPSTNLLSVAGLQLSGATNTPTFSAGVLTCGCNESSSRQFQIGMTANITGLTLSNRRTNGVYTCSIYNVSGSTWSIDHILTGSASNKTDYNTAINIANGDFAVLTARTLLTNGTAYNYVSVVKYA